MSSLFKYYKIKNKKVEKIKMKEYSNEEFIPLKSMDNNFGISKKEELKILKLIKFFLLILELIATNI